MFNKKFQCFLIALLMFLYSFCNVSANLVEPPVDITVKDNTITIRSGNKISKNQWMSIMVLSQDERIVYIKDFVSLFDGSYNVNSGKKMNKNSV